jgi:hypothetical protein
MLDLPSWKLAFTALMPLEGDGVDQSLASRKMAERLQRIYFFNEATNEELGVIFCYCNSRYETEFRNESCN